MKCSIPAKINVWRARNITFEICTHESSLLAQNIGGVGEPVDIIERIDPFKHRNELMYPEHLGRYMFASQFIKNQNVLDCSCGNGYGTNFLAQHQASSVLGIDIAPEAVDFAKQHYWLPDLRFELGDATNLRQVDDNSIDVYVSFETIEHLQNPGLMLAEAKRVLNTRGIMLVSCPNDNVFNPHNPYHADVYTYDKFLDLMKQYFSYIQPFVQNNTSGTSILPPQKVEMANENRDSIINAGFLVTSRKTETADTWLFVCSDVPLASAVMPVTSFFPTYSNYILEVQETLNSLYDENQRLATAWTQHTEEIKAAEAEIKRITAGWEKQGEYIRNLEREIEAMRQKLDEKDTHVESLQAENKKLAEAWQTHVDYIHHLEEKLKEVSSK